MPDAKSDAPLAKKKKKQSVASMQRELRELGKPAADAPEKPPVDLKKIYLRVGGVLALIWVVALVLIRWSIIPVVVAGVLTAVAAGAGIWLARYLKKTRELGALMKGATESEEGRQACMQDAFKFCSDAIPDRERVFQGKVVEDIGDHFGIKRVDDHRPRRSVERHDRD